MESFWPITDPNIIRAIGLGGAFAFFAGIGVGLASLRSRSTAHDTRDEIQAENLRTIHAARFRRL